MGPTNTSTTIATTTTASAMSSDDTLKAKLEAMKKMAAAKGPINAIILEDEEESMELLVNLLGEHCPNVNIVGTGTTIVDGVRLITDTSIHIDVAFLDIRLDDGLVFDMFKFLNNVTFDVIFVTAWDEYFQQACGYYSIGYILKPIDTMDLLSAIAKVRTYTDAQALTNYNISINELMNQVKNPHLAGKFPIPMDKGYYFVELDDIIRLEGLDNYTKIYTKTETLMTSRTLKVFDKLLEPMNFFRIHKQHIINLRCIKYYIRKVYAVEMIDGKNIQVAKRRKAAFLKIMKGGPFI